MIPEFNVDSSEHVSILLFGGEFEEELEVPVLNEDGSYYCYKSGARKGEIKYKKDVKKIPVKGFGLKPLDEWRTIKKKVIYQTNEEVLELISKKDSKAGEVAKLILELRKLQKDISTYYEAIEERIYPDNKVRTEFQTVLTPTCRVSSKNPNLQNQKNDSDCKLHFTSRYPNGTLLQADYKQIEVVVFGHCINDPVLNSLLLNNQDIHKYIASHLFNKPEEEVTQEERYNIKPCTFGIIYGGSKYSLHYQSGLDLELCENFIQVFFDNFKKAGEWHKHICDLVEKKGQLQSFTGRILKFNKYPSKHDWERRKYGETCYSFKQVKNYPIQSMAGDILFCMLGKLWRKLIHHREKGLLVNTVHDSVILDVREAYKTWFKILINNTLTEWSELCYNNWKINWELPIKIEISEGKSWGECK